MKTDTKDTCHCGGKYNGSDHCPECYCEQYETYNEDCEGMKLITDIQGDLNDAAGERK